MFIISVSVDQKSGYCLTGSSTLRSLKSVQSKRWPGLDSYLKASLGTHPLATSFKWLLVQFSSSRDDECSFSLAVGQRLSSVHYCMGFSNTATFLIKAIKRIWEQKCKSPSFITIMEGTSHYLCYIIWARSKSLDLAHIRGGNYKMVCKLGGGDHCISYTILEVCLLQKSSN